MQPNACNIRKLKDDMTTPPPSGVNGGPPRRREELPSEIMDIIGPALQVGGLSGISGFTVGAFAGIVRSNTPVLFALASGIQWFTLGTSFWASRGFIIHAWGKDKVTSRDKVSASAIAGGFGGGVGGLLRGHRNIIPGAIMFSVFGAVGQALYNTADARYSESSGEGRRDLKDSWLNSKWSPVEVLSNEAYQKLLEERLLKVDAEIALIDESIEALRVQEKMEIENEKTRSYEEK